MWQDIMEVSLEIPQEQYVQFLIKLPIILL